VSSYTATGSVSSPNSARSQATSGPGRPSARSHALRCSMPRNKSVWNGRLLPQQDCVDVLEGATYS